VEGSDSSLTYSCDKFTTEFPKISNCFVTVKKTTSGGITAQYCKYCSKPYKSTALDATQSGAADCEENAEVISFCRYSYRDAGGDHCWACQDGYVLTSDISRCVRHKDINCRQTVDQIGNICGSCWYGF